MLTILAGAFVVIVMFILIWICIFKLFIVIHKGCTYVH